MDGGHRRRGRVSFGMPGQPEKRKFVTGNGASYTYPKYSVSIIPGSGGTNLDNMLATLQ